MDVIRNKIKLVDRKEGTISVFLSGMQTQVSDYLADAIKRYADPESRFGVIVEPYVAAVAAPAGKTPGKAAAQQRNEPKL